MNRSFTSKNVFLKFALFAGIALSATNAFAQVENPSQISIQGIGLFTTSLNNQSPSYSATKSGGVLAGYSYQFNRNFSAEGNYGYTRNVQNFSSTAFQSDIHQATGALVWHIPAHIAHISPYALGGGGTLTFNPTDKFTVAGADTQTKGTFVYGGGANIYITSKFGFRAEYRGLVYKVPDFKVSTLSIDKFTHLAQPSFGFYTRF